MILYSDDLDFLDSAFLTYTVRMETYMTQLSVVKAAIFRYLSMIGIVGIEIKIFIIPAMSFVGLDLDL